MKKLITTALITLLAAFGANATVLFPHFVDIAPNYEEGNSEELKGFISDKVLYHSTIPGLTSKFSDVISFFHDTLPSDVKIEERKIGDKRLLVVSSLHKCNDTIATSHLLCTIYVLELPDDKFCAVYCEREKEINEEASE